VLSFIFESNSTNTRTVLFRSYIDLFVAACVATTGSLPSFTVNRKKFWFALSDVWHSVLWNCWLGSRKGIRPVKCKIEWWGAGVLICLEWGADLHMFQLKPLLLTVSCFSKIQIGLPFWYRLTWVVPEKGLLNGCVCVCKWYMCPYFVKFCENCQLFLFCTIARFTS